MFRTPAEFATGEPGPFSVARGGHQAVMGPGFRLHKGGLFGEVEFEALGECSEVFLPDLL